MLEEKVGFITPQNEVFLMNYNEVNNFCKEICFRKDNINDFLEFEKDYTYFYPYFDFVMFKLDYIFINPLLEEDTYLKKIKNALYKVNKSDIDDVISYDSISLIAQRIQNGKNYAHLVACSDKELRISMANSFMVNDCMIDPNGYTLMSTNDGEENGNHEVTSNTIVNQLLISNNELWKSYNNKEYSTIYLIEKFGFIRASSLNDSGILIGVDRFLSDIVKEFRNLCVNQNNCVFYDWEKQKKVKNENIENYDIKRR